MALVGSSDGRNVNHSLWLESTMNDDLTGWLLAIAWLLAVVLDYYGLL